MRFMKANMQYDQSKVPSTSNSWLQAAEGRVDNERTWMDHKYDNSELKWDDIEGKQENIWRVARHGVKIH